MPDGESRAAFAALALAGVFMFAGPGVAAPSANAPAPRPAGASSPDLSPAGLQAALQSWRTVGAAAPQLLLARVDQPWTSDGLRIFGPADDRLGHAAWRRFFEDAVWIGARQGPHDAVAALWSPVYDAMLVVSWRATPRGWTPVALRAAALHDGADGAAPQWLAQPGSGGWAAALRAARPPSAAQILDRAHVAPSPADEAAVRARIVALQQGLAGDAASGDGSAALGGLLTALWTGDASALTAHGVDATAAAALARLPPPLRGDLVVLGAVRAPTGVMMIVRAEAEPGLYYLIAADATRAARDITPVSIRLGG